jgi:hypothetical protein
MATDRAYLQTRLAIELAGAAPVFVDSVTVPNRTFAASGAPGLGTFEARVAVSEAGALLGWVLSLARGKGVDPAGTVVVANVNLDRLRRFDWPAGSLTRLQLSTLDASASKLPFAASFQWQPEALTTAKDSGKLQAAQARKQKAWLCSNFRVKIGGLPALGGAVVKVDLPTVTGKVAERTGTRRRAAASSAEFGPMRVTVSAAGIDAARDWVQTLAGHGGVLPGDLQTVSIEMLEPTLARALGTIQVEGCSLQAWDEAPLDAAGTAPRTAVLTFAVQGMDLKLAA